MRCPKPTTAWSSASFWMRLVACVLALSAPVTVNAAQELSLSDAIALARGRHPTLVQAELDISRARLSTLRAQLERLQFTIRASYSDVFQRLNVNGPPEICRLSVGACANEARLFETSATLRLLLWSGLTVEAHVDGARQEVRASEADQRSAVNNLTLVVVEAYWAVRRGELLREVVLAALSRNQAIERVVQKKVDAGIAPLPDFRRTQALVLGVQRQLNNLESVLIDARAHLASVLQVDGDFRLVEPLTAQPTTLPELPQAEREALAARPELRAIDARVQVHAHSVRAIHGAYWPHLSLVGQAQVQNQSYFLPGQRRDLILNLFAGLEITWTLSNVWDSWIAARQTEMLRARVEADRDLLRRNILADVRTIHGQLSRALERLSLADQAATALRESASLLRDRYRVGSTLLIELLIAHGDLAEMESEQIAAQVALAELQARFSVVLGGCASGQPLARRFGPWCPE